ncbi:MFS transporter [Xanthomonas hyacinthi]
MFMAVLDSTIVNVALPAMRADLGAKIGGLAWIVDAYTLSMAALILAGGILADRFGAKTVYLTGLGFFVGASALCGVADSVPLLVAARLVQGMGAALFLPASLAIVRGTFDDPDERARAIATWAGIASVAAAVGPVVGGLLIDGFGWRSVFFVNVPAGAIVFGLTARIVRPQPSRAAKRFDWGGQISSAAMLGALCFAAIELPQQGMSAPAVWLAGLAAVAAAAVWVTVERRIRDPMVPLAWFRNSAFVAANLVGCLVYIGYFGLLFILSLYLHGSYGLDARETGFALLPVVVSLTVGNVLAGRLQGRWSSRVLITGGLGFAALSAPLIAELLVGHAWWPAIIVAFAVFGVGTALSVPPMISTVLEQVPDTASGVASGLLNALRQAGSLLGVAAASAAATLEPHLPAAMRIVAIVSGGAYAAAALVAVVGMRSSRSDRR